MFQPNFYLKSTEPVSYGGQPITQITDHVWLGSVADLGKPYLLFNAGITALLCVALDFWNNLLGWPEFVSDQVGLIDAAGNPPEAFQAAVLALDALVQQGYVVLVYCHQGLSRSPAVVIRYLDFVDPKGWNYWFNFVLDRRFIDINPALIPTEPEQVEFVPVTDKPDYPAVVVEQEQEPVVIDVDVKMKWNDGTVEVVNYGPKEWAS